MHEENELAPALGKIASGLYILTAQVDGEPHGMLASFIEQAAFEPPMISLAVGKERPILQALDGHGMFGVHVLSKANSKLIGTFSRLNPEGDPFANHELAENLFGIPQLTEAQAFLACKVANKMDAGDHALYLAEVVEGVLQHPSAEPMIRIRSNGLKY